MTDAQRWSAEEAGETLRIEIAPRRQWTGFLRPLLWLTAFALILQGASVRYGLSGPVIVLPLILIAAAIAAAAWNAAWTALGREVIAVEDGYLRAWQQLGTRSRRQREYRVDRIHNLRIEEAPRRGRSSWVLGRGPIAFDCGHATYRLGEGLDRMEARGLLEALERKIGR